MARSLSFPEKLLKIGLRQTPDDALFRQNIKSQALNVGPVINDNKISLWVGAGRDPKKEKREFKSTARENRFGVSENSHPRQNCDQ